MKPLYNYILEQAIGNIGITFDEFNQYIDNHINGKYNDALDDRFKKRFPSNYWRMRDLMDEQIDAFIYDLSKMKVDIDDYMIRFLYDKLCNTPDTKITKFVGYGVDAVAFDLGDKIIKCFYKNSIHRMAKQFYEYCMKYDNPICPKIYRIGKGYVVMEKLKMETPKVKRLFKLMRDDVKLGRRKDTIYHYIQDGYLTDERYVALPMEYKEVADFLFDAQKLIADIKGITDWKSNQDMGDLSIDNVGERADGTLIYFDPVLQH